MRKKPSTSSSPSSTGRRRKPVAAGVNPEPGAKRIAACSKCNHIWTPKGYKLGRCPVCQDDLSAHYISGTDKIAA